MFLIHRVIRIGLITPQPPFCLPATPFFQPALQGDEIFDKGERERWIEGEREPIISGGLRMGGGSEGRKEGEYSNTLVFSPLSFQESGIISIRLI